MKKWLVILFPVAVRAADIYSAADGIFTQTAVWVGGALPSTGDSAFITNNIVVDTSRTLSNLTIRGGVTVTMTNTISFTINNDATISSATLKIVRGSFLVNNSANSTAKSPLIVSAGTIDGTGVAAPSVYVYASRNGVTNDLSTIFTNATITGLGSFRGIGCPVAAGSNSVSILTNVNFIGKATTVVFDSFGSSIVDGSTFASLSIGSAFSQKYVSLQNSTISGSVTWAQQQIITNTVNFGGATMQWGAFNFNIQPAANGLLTLHMTNTSLVGNLSAALGTLSASTFGATNLTIRGLSANGSLWLSSNVTVDNLIATNGIMRFATAINAGTVTVENGATLQPQGNTLTATNLLSKGTVLGSNATFIISRDVENRGTFTPETLTLQFGGDAGQGLLSNVPSLVNLIGNAAGKSLSIISNLTVTSTASFSASGSSPGIISGAPCLLTLSNAGTAFGYGLSNIGVAAYRPLYTWGGVTDRKTATGNVQQVGKYQIIQ